MTYRFLVRVLLSLMLLLSQQMAIAHAVSHWTGTLAPAAERQTGDSELSSAFAHDRSCAQCLAFAQLGFAVGHAPRQFVPPEEVSEQGQGSASNTVCTRVPRLFDSRGPPARI